MVKRIPATLVVALLALGLTATAAFAGGGPHTFGPQVADPTPVNVVDESPSATVSPDTENDEPTDGDEDEDEGDEVAGPHPTNHGLTVSTAAKATTPPGCKNHGQYVSLVARGLIDPNAPPAPVAEGETPPSVCDVVVAPEASVAPKAHGNAYGKLKQHGKPKS